LHLIYRGATIAARITDAFGRPRLGFLNLVYSNEKTGDYHYGQDVEGGAEVFGDEIDYDDG
jgi:hypothetical protein